MSAVRPELSKHLSFEPVRVVVPQEAAFDLNKMQKITATVLGRLGCDGCHSGFDIRFIHARDFVVNPKTLEVQATAGEISF